MKEHNPAVKFIDTTHYKGTTGEDKKISKSTLVLFRSQLMMNHQKEPFYGKCINICHGGGKISTHELVNQQSLLKITFYLQRGDDFHACTPITGRVVHVHKKEIIM